MKKGYLSHYCCCGHTAYKQSIICVNDNILCNIDNFITETPNTSFYDGLLIVVSHSFHPQKDIFLKQLQEALKENQQLTITNAVQQNDIYRNNPATIGSECLIYTISPITWHTLRPTDPMELRIKLI